MEPVALTRCRRGNGEAVLGHCHQRSAGLDGNEARQRQQSRVRFRYHVYCRAVSALSEGALEVSQDGRQQALRIYARDA